MHRIFVQIIAKTAKLMTFIKFVRIGYALVLFQVMVHFTVQRFVHLSVYLFVCFPKKIKIISHYSIEWPENNDEYERKYKTKAKPNNLQIESMKCIPKDSVD